MKIIETFICLIPIRNIFVKVHRGRGVKGNYMYFIEIEDRIEEIGELYFNQIKNVE